jgi:iron complex outermembrane receptor protein
MKRLILLSSVAACIAFIPGAAFAQSTDTAPQATSAVGDDAIIVTARRRAEDAAKVPIAIVAFSGDQLVAKGITNTLDLTKVSPGLNIAGGGTVANPFIVIRGQSKAVTGNGSAGVITYMNDVPLPSYGSLIQTYDMANVQVLKGPQGTLFGRNSIGGALLTNTVQPTHDFGGYAMVDVAQYDYHQFEGAINVPIISEKVALRLATQIGHDGGNVKTFYFSPYTISVDPTSPTFFNAKPGVLVPNSRNADEIDNYSYRASLLIEPTDWIKNVTIGDYSKIKGLSNTVNSAMYPGGLNGGNPALYYLPGSVVTAALTPSAGPAFAAIYGRTIDQLAHCGTQINCDTGLAQAATANNIRDRVMFATLDPGLSRTTIKGITNTTTIRIGDNHQLKNIFAIRTTDSFTNTSLSGVPIPIITTTSVTRLKQTTDELQLSGSFFDNDLDYTIGGFMYEEKPNGLGGYQALEVNAFLGLSHSLAVTYLKNKSKAVYGQFDYSLDRFLPGLSVTAGARQTWDTQSACTTAQSISPLGPMMVNYSPSEKDQAGIYPSAAECAANAGLAANAAGNTLPAGTTAQNFADAKFKKLTYTLGANWQISPAAMVYVVRRRGYRAGGYNTPQFIPFLASLQTFAPETLQDWEIGTKLRFNTGGMRGSLDLALFTGKDSNNQLPVSTSNLGRAICVAGAPATAPGTTVTCPAGQGPVYHTGQTTTVNAATLTIRGIEAVGTFSPTSFVTLTGSFSYTQVKVDSISLPANLAAWMSTAGRPIPQDVVIQGQPKWTWNAGANFAMPQKVLGGDLSVGLDFHYNGSYRQVEVQVPSWKSLDARMTLADIGDTRVNISAYVKNLTDETIYLGGGATSPSGIGAGSWILGRSRTAGLQLTYRFGS